MGIEKLITAISGRYPHVVISQPGASLQKRFSSNFSDEYSKPLLGYTGKKSASGRKNFDDSLEYYLRDNGYSATISHGKRNWFEKLMGLPHLRRFEIVNNTNGEQYTLVISHSRKFSHYSKTTLDYAINEA